MSKDEKDKSLVGDKVTNVVELEMTPREFADKLGLKKRKGKVTEVYARLSNYDGKVRVEVRFETEDRLKQIDYTKTVEE